MSVVDAGAGQATGAARDALTVTVWTMVSRVAGFAKVAVIAAVLGPTFFGNAYQFINSLPNFIFYGFLAGSLFSSLLVPALVGHLDRGDSARSQRIAGGFLGLSLVLLLPAVPLAILVGPALLELSGAGMHDQSGAARTLVVLVVPQLFFYAVVGTGSAAMNASQRFALAAAAPAVESVGTIVVLICCAAIYGLTDSPGTGELLLLGLGSTAAVALHAAVQWFGARRAGTTVVPRKGWTDAEVRTIARRAIPSLGQAGLMAIQMITLLALANRIAGGVVGFQIAVNFYFLAVALCATPAALSVLPRLARRHDRGDNDSFGRTLGEGYTLALFLAVPISAGYLALAVPIADSVSFGRMGQHGGATLVAAALAPLAFAVVGQTIFAISSYACYARKDTTSPLYAMAGQALACLGLAATSTLVHGAAVTFVLGAAFATSVLGSGLWLSARLRRLAAVSTLRLRRPLVDSALGTVAMIAPAWAVAHYGSRVLGGRLAVSLAVLCAAVVFFAIERLVRAEALGLILAGLRPSRTAEAAVGNG